MPRKKSTVAEVVTEVAAEETAKPVVEAPAEKAAEKPAEKPAKKAAEKKAPAKKAPAKEPAVKAKAAAPKETVKLQFCGEEYDLAAVKSAVEADYKSKFNGKVKTVEIYIKPEDKAVYYVVNSEFSDKVGL